MTQLFHSRGSIIRILIAAALISLSSASLAQTLRREWIRTHTLYPQKYNRAQSIALAPDGNIVVLGNCNDSGTSAGFDYAIIKYSPTGDEVWRAQYGSPVYTVTAMTIDPAGNVITTGSAGTVKFSPAGQRIWTSPLGGRAVVANSQYIYVTGFLNEDIATAQLENNDTDGHENWRHVVDSASHGTDIGEAITLDAAGNVYVAGRYDGRRVPRDLQFGFATISYNPQGAVLWIKTSVWSAPGSQATSIAVAPDGATYVLGHAAGARLLKYDSAGNESLSVSGFGWEGTKLLIDPSTSRVFATGRDFDLDLNREYSAFVHAFETNGTHAEISSYPGANPSRNTAVDIVQDSLGHLYVLGHSASDTASASIFLLNITTAGDQLALDRYNGPTGGSSFPAGMVIDTNNNIYVTASNTLPDGASEIVTIKYVIAPKIEPQPDGVMHLEFRAAPNQSYAIETTTDFLTWQNLTTTNAAATGLLRFNDTNAATFPLRFYRAKQP